MIRTWFGSSGGGLPRRPEHCSGRFNFGVFCIKQNARPLAGRYLHEIRTYPTCLSSAFWICSLGT